MSGLPAGEAHAPGARGPQGTIPLAVPNIGPLEVEYVTRAVESGYVSSVGPFVNEFEEVFAELVGASYAVACATGTAALHVGLLVLGVQPGDEVVVLGLHLRRVGEPHRLHRRRPGLRRLRAHDLEHGP